MSAAPPNSNAEFIVGCRSCGNHCLAIERVRSVEVSDEVPYSDGYLGGWHGVQTEVVTCPHCGIAISWRKNCVPADQLRQAGDLGRFFLPLAGWGPASMYWAGVRKYDDLFHPPGKGGATPEGGLPRLAAPPDSSALWALRKRGSMARGLLWLENDRDRFEFFFGGTRPSPANEIDLRRRTRLLRALLEASLFGENDSEANRIDTAEWYRELGEWDNALQALGRPFKDRFLADRARQLREMVEGQITTVMPFEMGDELREEIERERQAKERPPPPPPAPKRARSAAIDPKSPLALLLALNAAEGYISAEALTRDHIPRPYGSLLRTLMKSYKWDEVTFAVAVIRGLAQAQGWPPEAEDGAREQLEGIDIEGDVLGYLATAFKRATWERWAFDVPATPKAG